MLFIGVMVMGCICMKCCWVFGIIRDDDDDDDEDWDENDFRRYKRDFIYLFDILKLLLNKKWNGLDFWWDIRMKNWIVLFWLFF